MRAEAAIQPFRAMPWPVRGIRFLPFGLHVSAASPTKTNSLGLTVTLRFDRVNALLAIMVWHCTHPVYENVIRSKGAFNGLVSAPTTTRTSKM